MPDTRESPEATIGELVELEEELTTAGGGVGGTYEEGTIAGVSKIPAGEVPDGYPVPIRTEHALHIDVETEGGTAPVFLEWPGDGEQSDHLDRLLDALHREPGEFADIYGDRVALESENGWHGIDVDRTATFHGAASARGDESLDQTKYLVVAAVAAGTLPYAMIGTGLETLAGVLLFVAWIGLPVSMYLDVQKVRTYLDWDTDATKWLIAGAIPMFNVVFGYAYLIDRHVQLQGVEGRRTSDVWYKTVLASIVLPVVGLVSVGVHAGLGTLLFLTSLVLLPIAIYFDAEYVEEATDWDPSEETWAIGAVIATALALWWVVGIAYVVKRHSEVG